MIILRNIVAATTSILLVLISTPAVVEGSCKCKDTCPNWERKFLCISSGSRECDGNFLPHCNTYCKCNFFGCRCKGCEAVPGACGYTRRMLDAEEKEETCADFDFFTSLSADGKRNSLAEKYCLEEDQVVRENIYELLRDFTVLQFDEGDDLTCGMFNKAYGDVSHLPLCDNKPLGLPASTKKGKKQKKTP